MVLVPWEEVSKRRPRCHVDGDDFGKALEKGWKQTDKLVAVALCRIANTLDAMLKQLAALKELIAIREQKRQSKISKVIGVSTEVIEAGDGAFKQWWAAWIRGKGVPNASRISLRRALHKDCFSEHAKDALGELQRVEAWVENLVLPEDISPYGTDSQTSWSRWLMKHKKEQGNDGCYP